MWKHSRLAYLGGASLAHSQLATTLLRALGLLVCDNDEVILQSYAGITQDFH